MPYTDWPDSRKVPEDELMLTTEEIADSRRPQRGLDEEVGRPA